MFETPSDRTIEKIIITKDVVENGAEPRILRRDTDIPLALEIGDDYKSKKDNAS